MAGNYPSIVFTAIAGTLLRFNWPGNCQPSHVQNVFTPWLNINVIVIFNIINFVTVHPPPPPQKKTHTQHYCVVRILMLGAPGVGKSSLCSQFLSSDHINTYVSVGRPFLILRTNNNRWAWAFGVVWYIRALSAGCLQVTLTQYPDIKAGRIIRLGIRGVPTYRTNPVERTQGSQIFMLGIRKNCEVCRMGFWGLTQRSVGQRGVFPAFFFIPHNTILACQSVALVRYRKEQKSKQSHDFSTFRKINTECPQYIYIYTVQYIPSRFFVLYNQTFDKSISVPSL